MRFILITLLTTFSAFAGVIVPKTGQAEAGTVTESGTTLSIQTTPTATKIDHPKDSLLWYSTDATLDTLFKAGQKATADGKNDAAIILFEQSIIREPGTKIQAETELESLRSSPPPPSPAAAAPPTSTPPPATTPPAPAEAPAAAATDPVAPPTDTAAAPAEAPKKNAPDPNIPEAKLVNDWTSQEMMVNAAAGGVVALIVLMILWQIAAKNNES